MTRLDGDLGPGSLVRLGVSRTGPAGLAAVAASVILTLVVAVAGPSVMSPDLPGRPGQPPWALDLHLPPYLAAALTAAALAAGAAGLALCLHAGRRGWTVSPRALLAAGVVAAALIALAPPFGSSDHLSYATYGRMAVTGHDPYTTTPATLARLGDPVARAVQDWRSSPSVYGSLATAGQALASLIGGTSVRLTVFVLSLLNLAAFAGTGLLLHRLTRGSAKRQFRAALVWTANPLLLQVLMAGAHVDSQAIVFAVAAVAIFAVGLRPGAGPAGVVGVAGGGTGPAAGWSFAVAAAAGAVAGLGFAVKVSMALVPAGLVAAAALAWWRGPRRPGARQRGGAAAGGRRAAPAAAGLAAGFAVTAGLSLVPWGLGSLGTSLRAGSLVSVGSPWRAIRAALSPGTGPAVAGDLVKVGAVALMLLIAALFLRRLAGAGPGAGQGGRRGGAQRGDLVETAAQWADPVVLAAAGAFALVFAWLVAWPYVLPWYESLSWALLALLPWGPPAAADGRGRAAPGGWLRRIRAVAVRPWVPWAALDWLVLARTTALALAYLPARGVATPAGLDWVRYVFRNAAAPVVLLAVAVAVVMLLWPGQPERVR